MKRILKINLFFVLLAVLLIPSTALAAEAESELSDEYVLGDNFTLESGEVLDEDLFIFGGNVELEEDSVVQGDIWLTGGNLVVDGEVEGTIRATGGTVDLGDTAVVGGDIQVLGAT
ncbi:MAG: polymer-forming cytoskeletal protein, partial [Chloroflexi bacterium]